MSPVYLTRKGAEQVDTDARYFLTTTIGISLPTEQWLLEATSKVGALPTASPLKRQRLDPPINNLRMWKIFTKNHLNYVEPNET